MIECEGAAVPPRLWEDRARGGAAKVLAMLPERVVDSSWFGTALLGLLLLNSPLVLICAAVVVPLVIGMVLALASLLVLPVGIVVVMLRRAHHGNTDGHAELAKGAGDAKEAEPQYIQRLQHALPALLDFQTTKLQRHLADWGTQPSWRHLTTASLQSMLTALAQVADLLRLSELPTYYQHLRRQKISLKVSVKVGFPQEQLHTTPEALHCLSGATGSPTKSPTALSCSATFTTVKAAREELTLHNHHHHHPHHLPPTQPPTAAAVRALCEQEGGRRVLAPVPLARAQKKADTGEYARGTLVYDRGTGCWGESPLTIEERHRELFQTNKHKLRAVSSQHKHSPPATSTAAAYHRTSWGVTAKAASPGAAGSQALSFAMSVGASAMHTDLVHEWLANSQAAGAGPPPESLPSSHASDISTLSQSASMPDLARLEADEKWGSGVAWDTSVLLQPSERFRSGSMPQGKGMHRSRAQSTGAQSPAGEPVGGSGRSRRRERFSHPTGSSAGLRGAAAAAVEAESARRRDGDAALRQAVLARGGCARLKALARAGCDVNAANRLGSTALHVAAYHGKGLEALRLVEAGANLDAQDEMGLSALHYAVWRGHLSVLSVLLTHGADIGVRCALHSPNATVGTSSLDPMHFALLQKNKLMVHMLLMHKDTESGCPFGGAGRMVKSPSVPEFGLRTSIGMQVRPFDDSELSDTHVDLIELAMDRVRQGLEEEIYN